MAKVCISGYYGYGSADQGLMLLSLVQALRRLDENMEIVVFSADTAETQDEFEVAAVSRDDWEAMKREMRSADLLISGGGHLLKETADLQEMKYYLKVIKTALRMKLPVFIYNQVLTPFTSSRAQKMVAHVMTKVRKITVADRQSVEVLHSMGIRRGRIHVLEDPVLMLKDVAAEWKLTDIAEGEKKKAPAQKEADAKEKTDAAVEAQKEPINYDGMDVEIEIRIVDKKDKEAISEIPTDTLVISELNPSAEGETAAEEAVAEVADDAEEVATEAEAAEVSDVAVEETVAKDVVEEAAEEDAAEPEKFEDKTPKAVPNRPRNLALVVPAFWKKPGEKFAAFSFASKAELPVSQITAMADFMVENGYQVVFLPMSYPQDAALSKEIVSMMKHPAYEVEGKMSPQSLYTAINEVDFVFTSEIYPMMLAAVCHKPIASLCCTERALDFISALGLTPTGSLIHYDSEAFIRNFKTAVSDPSAIVTAIGENLEELREKADEVEDQLQRIFAQIERNRARKERAQSRPAQKEGGETAAVTGKDSLKNLFSFGEGKKKDVAEEAETAVEAEEAILLNEEETVDVDRNEETAAEIEVTEEEISVSKESK